MKRFTQLYSELDRTNRTNEKVAALESYFRDAAPADAAWALHFLGGRKLPRAINSTTLRALAAEEAGLPSWLMEECYQAVGDLAETVALILPPANSRSSLPLHRLVEERLLPLHHGPSGRAWLLQTWRELAGVERFVWNKLITGSFRVGVAQTLVARALAAVAGIDPAIMAHRLMGLTRPSAVDFQRIMEGRGAATQDAARPYPFFLASPLSGSPAELGDLREWQIEWKWDGIRGQLIRRQNQVLVWSRGDEMLNETFPEMAELGEVLPDGTVLDGEILAWANEQPQPFGRLQRRLGRKTVDARMRARFPVVFLAFDLLESEGEDWRQRPLHERRQRLELIVQEATSKPVVAGRRASAVFETPDLFERELPSSVARWPLRLSPVIPGSSWEELARLRAESRARYVEGIMLKRHSSAYGVGRQRGDWWKWKIEPLVMDAVLIGAQLGHGRRASLYTDYTFGVWHGDGLVPVAKAYSGLSDDEIAEVDRFVRANTAGRFGPVRAVRPALVFELAFEGIQTSSRHKAGIAVRFPRMNRWRRDKKPEDADTLETLRALLGKELDGE